MDKQRAQRTVHLLQMVLFSHPVAACVCAYVHVCVSMRFAVLCLAAQPSPTPCNPTDCSLPGSSVHGIL